MKIRLVHPRAVARAFLSSAAALVAASFGVASAAAAEILPCEGVSIDLAQDGAQLGEETLAAVFPDGVLGKGTVFTTDVRGEVFASSDAGWLWADAWGDVDLEAGGDVTACIDHANQRVTFTWQAVAQSGGEATVGNTFQMVLRASRTCEAGAELEVRIAELGWPILLEAGSPDGFAPFGFHADHEAGSNVGEPGIYRFDSCPQPCPAGAVAEGLRCVPDPKDSERGHVLEVTATSQALPSAAAIDEDIIFTGSGPEGAQVRSADADDTSLTDADHEDEESHDEGDDIGHGCSAGGGSSSVAEGLIALLGLAAGAARRGRRVSSRG
jgi:MYXO-CTERM domain-containing protein